MGDVSFKLLPPELQVKLWVLGLDANTSKVNIAYKTPLFSTGLAYNYGGNLEAFMAIEQTRVTLGANPSSGDASVKLVYRGFNFGGNYSPSKQSGGASFGYGADLLPFPWELAGTFATANGGLMNMARDIQAAPNNPLAWYNLHSNDFDAVSKAATAIQNISKRDKNNNFGVGLRVNYTPQSGILIYGGVQYHF